MSTTGQFTERDVSEFFDQTTQTYLSFWDSEGVLHTGYFADADDTDYPAAADRTSDILAADAGIDASSTVLDVGCGCGNFLLRLAEHTGCRGEGLDLSIERVRFAQTRLAERGSGLPIAFQHGSATAMPYADGSFSHVVSQDALFLVPDKARSHAEMFRVLTPGGTLAVTDFLQPVAEVGEAARRHVYDRVRWSSGYSLDGYREALTAAGFEVTVARSLDTHIRQTYRVLGETARQRAAISDDEAARRWILGFAASCDEIQAAIDRGEFGWGMFVARKPA
ncbi:methyltransferase domain-containing protein [Micromonospora sp. HM134]|uniref:class I SAM-dependent methyltransferase n=1 Tax=unclassified Micromonospora TaxID=2617518 RepID=UPI001198838A|nr:MULTISPECIES: class I SAM-dependent methyltransferase [unclassified Micromonospora]QDY08659.1 methyltransferase domain-containing protein [Micromonospora sp. HM134]